VVTAISPLQFHKWRRLMLSENLDAASVGYGNTSHVTREYERLFGAAPMRHANGYGKAPGNEWVKEAFRSSCPALLALTNTCAILGGEA
jgi:AraC-like DNA-binding protein